MSDQGQLVIHEYFMTPYVNTIIMTSIKKDPCAINIITFIDSVNVTISM